VDDQSILSHIEALVAEEHELADREEKDATSAEALAADRDRLRAVSLELDRYWDLLRQRRALREAGRSPDAARPRDENTVERYLQ
jgi:hypothetical protein